MNAMLQKQRLRRWADAALAAIGLTAAIIVIAIAGRAPLSRSTPVNAASASAPVTALCMLFMGAGIAALAALGALSWPGRRRKGDDEPEFVPEPLQVHWVWKLLAIVLPFALGAALIAAAVLGAKTVRPAPQFGGSGTVTRPPQPPPAPSGGGGAFVLPSWLPWTALVIVLMALVSGGILLLRRARSVEEPPERRASRAAVEAALGALDASSDPRSGVIAAYAAMERTLAAHGMVRSRAEAPREYLRRLLVASSGAEGDARTLTGLFEEARFSTHPIPERLRELALSALSSLRARLGTEASG